MKVLWSLRLGALALLIAVAGRPVAVRPSAGLPASWAVLIDRSASMNVADPTKRFDAARTLASEIARRYPHFDIFSFGAETEKASAGALEALEPGASRSNIAGAIRDVLEGKSYRGAIVLTDGRQVGRGDAVREAASAGHPLLLVGFGNKSLFKDVAVKAIQSPPFAFKNVSTSLSATIASVGYPGQRIAVRLKEGPKVLSLQSVQSKGREIESTVSFNWTPRELGSKTLSVETDVYAGEFTKENNARTVNLDVGRDRFRVLYLCGQPGPEYGFLRHQFKSDPAVELVTFVILRGSNNILDVPDAELSLIPFPTQDVLINQIASFDLIVFEEFAYQQFGLLPQVIYAVRKRVESGGSFLLLGGADMLGPGSAYAVPGIEEMIPVRFGTPEVREIRGPLQLVPKAPNHPILRLSGAPERNKEIWRAMPAVEDITLFPEAKPGAAVLAVVETGGREYPVLTTWSRGKGRVAVLSTRTTWRFAMLGEDAVGSAQVYQDFWKNMVLWLTHSDDFKPVRVAIDQKSLPLGEEDVVRVWAYDAYFKPISDVTVKIQATGPDGRAVELKPYQETGGVFAAAFRPEAVGSHTIRAWAYRQGSRLGMDSLTMRVVDSFREADDLRPDFEHLNALARATGGRFVTSDAFSLDAFDRFNEEMEERVGTKVLVWNSPWFLAALLAFVFLEWFLRKRRGLP